MRSRYAAYAKGLVEYIVHTTDPRGSHWREDSELWLSEIRAFCEQTSFQGLTILDAPSPGKERGFVSFRATLQRGGKDTSFAEKSTFRLVDGRWLYSTGEPLDT